MEAGAGPLETGGEESFVGELVDWSKRSAGRMIGIVQRQVQRQLRLAGAATQDELRELRKRVRSLERQLEKTERGSSKDPSSKASSKKAPAKRTRSKA